MQRQRLYNLLTVALLLTVTVGGLAYTQLAASAYIQRIVIGLGISIILVVSLNLSNGFTGVFSLGHVGFMAIGAYTAAILTLPLALKRVNLPDLPGWLADVQLSFLPATLIGADIGHDHRAAGRTLIDAAQRALCGRGNPGVPGDRSGGPGQLGLHDAGLAHLFGGARLHHPLVGVGVGDCNRVCHLATGPLFIRTAHDGDP